MKTLEIAEGKAAAIAELCRRFAIRELAIFGSVARGEERKGSDVDVYVEFEFGKHPGLGWFDLEEELEGILGRRVDLSRKELLKARVGKDAAREAIVLFAG